MEFSRIKLNWQYIDYLIKHAVVENINTMYPIVGGFTLLHVAAFNNDQKLVDDLLRKKADVNLTSKYWGTALHIAILSENLGIMQSLINYGADVNSQLIADFRLIRYRYGDWQYGEKAPEFLSKEKDVVSEMLKTYDSCFGKSPLQIAVDRRNEKMVELLLINNAHPNLYIYGTITPLISAIAYKNLPIIKHLLAYGVDVNSPIGSNIAESPLHIAVCSGNQEAVELILNHNMVNVNIVNIYNLSALHYAFFAPDDNIIRQLLDAGVDINIKDDNSALNYTFHSPDDNIMRQALNTGVDIYIKNVNCKTAFTARPIDSEKVKDTIAEHIAQLSAVNFHVDEENLAVVDNGSEKFCELRGQCINEVEKMKLTFIGTSNVTFYNVLCDNCEHKLALGLKYVSKTAILSLNIPSLFPLYSGMITYRLRKVLRRKRLLSHAIGVIEDIFDDIQLPIMYTIRSNVSVLDGHKELQLHGQ
ncbi:putative ankyrin repeat protein RF_0381 [Microplitis mediator]|uniref:putative ankyrin repeat protein RF_0381 n=1 Tax=Microplitis mediator TaxID=375433 RepID=UPI002557BBA9|nr:putative ankyrin repeat protein RF_0381 [Microplitis mediator]